MALQAFSHTRKDGIISIADDGDAHLFTIEGEVGDLSVTRPGNAKIDIFDRGEFSTVPDIRLGDAAAITFSFTVYLRDLSSDTEAVLMDIVNWTGFVASDWVSTHPAPEIKTVTVRYTIDGTNLGIADKTVRFDYCTLEASFTEGDPSSISIAGICHQSNYVIE